MIYPTGSTHLAPTTGVTSYYRQQRHAPRKQQHHTPHLPKLNQREVVHRANDLHRTQDPVKVIKAAHLTCDLYKAHMTGADYRKGIDLHHYKFLCNSIAHSDGPTPHLKGNNPYAILPNDPLRRDKEFLAWHDLADAINLFEAHYYPDEATSDPAYDTPTTRR